MAISQQDYYLKPGETTEQYNARIASLRAAETATPTTTPASTTPVWLSGGNAANYGATPTTPATPTTTPTPTPVTYTPPTTNTKYVSDSNNFIPVGSPTNMSSSNANYFRNLGYTVTDLGNGSVKVENTGNVILGTQPQTTQPTTQPTTTTQTTQPGAVSGQQTGGNTYTVQQGDTLSAIAQRLGVNVNSITGYSSGNPNLIRPGEVLTIKGTSQGVAQGGMTREQAIAGLAATGMMSPDEAEIQSYMAGGGTTGVAGNIPSGGNDAALKQLADLQTQVKELQGKQETITEAGTKGLALTENTTYQDAVSYLETLGTKTTTAPEVSWQETYSKLFTDLGLDVVKTNINDTIAKIQAIDNELADKISEVNDNPWISEALRSSKVTSLQNKYADKKQALTSALTLYQNTYESGRKEAQFLVTTALSQYNADRKFELDEQQLLADQAEAAAAALADLSKTGTDVIEANGRKYLVTYDKDGNVVNKVDIGAASESGAAGLTAAQINTTVNSIAGAFDNEQTVKDYNSANSQYQLMDSIGTKTSSPGDDIAFVYAFAKLMDPNSVVREGEYNTIQKYAQSLLSKSELDAVRLVKNSNFLSSDAKDKLLNTAGAKMDVLIAQYQNVYNEYQRQIDDAYSGKPRTITNYSIGSNDIFSSLDDDISSLASQYDREWGREALIDELIKDYPELDKQSIADRVYTLISSK